MNYPTITLSYYTGRIAPEWWPQSNRNAGWAYAYVATGTGLADVLEPFKKDVIKTAKGKLEITFVNHGSLMLKFGSKIIHVDPYSKMADKAKLPKANLIAIIHEHQGHLDPVVMQHVTTQKCWWC